MCVVTVGAVRLATSTRSTPATLTTKPDEVLAGESNMLKGRGQPQNPRTLVYPHLHERVKQVFAT